MTGQAIFGFLSLTAEALVLLVAFRRLRAVRSPLALMGMFLLSYLLVAGATGVAFDAVTRGVPANSLDRSLWFPPLFIGGIKIGLPIGVVVGVVGIFLPPKRRV
jgi:hypothetical protein